MTGVPQESYPARSGREIKSWRHSQTNHNLNMETVVGISQLVVLIIDAKIKGGGDSGWM